MFDEKFAKQGLSKSPTRPYTTAEETLDSFFAADPALSRDPYGCLDKLREEAPVYLHRGTVVLSRHHDVAELWRDPALFAKGMYAEAEVEGTTYSSAEKEPLSRAYRDVAAVERLFLSRVDGEKWHRIRGAVKGPFAQRAIGQLDTELTQICGDLIDAIPPAAEVDLMEFAFRFPMLAILRVLGLPEADATLVDGWIGKLTAFMLNPQPRELSEWHDALEHLRLYLDNVRSKHVLARESVLGSVFAKQHDPLTAEEGLAVFLNLLAAGRETTTHLIGNGLKALLMSPGAWTRLGDEPELAPAAVEEALRYDPPVQFVYRVPVRSVEFGGVAIDAGTPIFGLIGPANRDPAVFDRPSSFDIERTGPRHVSFGLGPRYCIGAGLARLQARLAFVGMTRTFPAAKPSTTDFEWKRVALLRGLERLNVTLGDANASSCGSRS